MKAQAKVRTPSKLCFNLSYRVEMAQKCFGRAKIFFNQMVSILKNGDFH